MAALPQNRPISTMIMIPDVEVIQSPTTPVDGLDRLDIDEDSNRNNINNNHDLNGDDSHRLHIHHVHHHDTQYSHISRNNNQRTLKPFQKSASFYRGSVIRIGEERNKQNSNVIICVPNFKGASHLNICHDTSTQRHSTTFKIPLPPTQDSCLAKTLDIRITQQSSLQDSDIVHQSSPITKRREPVTEISTIHNIFDKNIHQICSQDQSLLIEKLVNKNIHPSYPQTSSTIEKLVDQPLHSAYQQQETPAATTIQTLHDKDIQSHSSLCAIRSTNEKHAHKNIRSTSSVPAVSNMMTEKVSGRFVTSLRAISRAFKGGKQRRSTNIMTSSKQPEIPITLEGMSGILPDIEVIPPYLETSERMFCNQTSKISLAKQQQHQRSNFLCATAKQSLFRSNDSSFMSEPNKNIYDISSSHKVSVEERRNPDVNSDNISLEVDLPKLTAPKITFGRQRKDKKCSRKTFRIPTTSASSYETSTISKLVEKNIRSVQIAKNIDSSNLVTHRPLFDVQAMRPMTDSKKRRSSKYLAPENDHKRMSDDKPYNVTNKDVSNLVVTTSRTESEYSSTDRYSTITGIVQEFRGNRDVLLVNQTPQTSSQNYNASKTNLFNHCHEDWSQEKSVLSDTDEEKCIKVRNQFHGQTSMFQPNISVIRVGISPSGGRITPLNTTSGYSGDKQKSSQYTRKNQRVLSDQHINDNVPRSARDTARTWSVPSLETSNCYKSSHHKQQTDLSDSIQIDNGIKIDVCLRPLISVDIEQRNSYERENSNGVVCQQDSNDITVQHTIEQPGIYDEQYEVTYEVERTPSVLSQKDKSFSSYNKIKLQNENHLLSTTLYSIITEPYNPYSKIDHSNSSIFDRYSRINDSIPFVDGDSQDSIRNDANHKFIPIFSWIKSNWFNNISDEQDHSSCTKLQSRHCILRHSQSYNGMGIYVSSDIHTHRKYFIKYVEATSPGDKAGLQNNDYILKINGKQVENVDFNIVLQIIKNGIQNDNLEFCVVNGEIHSHFKYNENNN